MMRIYFLFLFLHSFLIAEEYKLPSAMPIIKLSKNKVYHIDKGWNYLLTPKEGLDIIAMFENIDSIKKIYLTDKNSKIIASYPKSKKILLKFLEENNYFYLYSTKSFILKINSTSISDKCQEIINGKKYKVLLSSAFDGKLQYHQDDAIGVRTRYIPNFKKNSITDTRILLIYPKVKNVTYKALFKYSPILPYVFLNFAREYEGKHFYIFDYYQKMCYQGLFPSPKIPPFATLRSLQ